MEVGQVPHVTAGLDGNRAKRRAVPRARKANWESHARRETQGSAGWGPIGSRKGQEKPKESFPLQPKGSRS
ncbi:hypothetical protein PHISP_05866 [Aspergillus sp. HF37]|nr:hypothetical protein PHISP_05866 [Aspergillus sp. HF37]